MIDGLMINQEKRISNPKGDILHAMKASSDGYISFGEAYFSEVHPGITKGWKRHKLATLNLIVPVGSIRFVIYDDRPDSKSKGEFVDVTLSENNNIRLTVSPGLWMAFKGVGDGLNMLLNVSNAEHDPLEADNIELGIIPFAWEKTSAEI
jgi:dTDP-4-dehydrorhamnose 3,5-epimerase